VISLATSKPPNHKVSGTVSFGEVSGGFSVKLNLGIYTSSLACKIYHAVFATLLRRYFQNYVELQYVSTELDPMSNQFYSTTYIGDTFSKVSPIYAVLKTCKIVVPGIY
jgi:hypothetical protein